MQPKSTLNSNHAGALPSKYFTLLSHIYSPDTTCHPDSLLICESERAHVLSDTADIPDGGLAQARFFQNKFQKLGGEKNKKFEKIGPGLVFLIRLLGGA